MLMHRTKKGLDAVNVFLPAACFRSRLWQALGPAIYAERRQPAPASSPNLGRRACIGAALAGAAYLAVRPAFDWPALPGMSSDYHTATGEQKQFALGPDVTVEMNTQTQINLRRPSADMPGIELSTGEAQVLIRTPAGAPFTLYAAGGEARASQAHVNVRHVDNDVCVSCLEGRAGWLTRVIKTNWPPANSPPTTPADWARWWAPTKGR